MLSAPQLLVAAASLAAACPLALPTRAGVAACDAASYSYVGMLSSSARYGVAARITALAPPRVGAGHVAAWVGVGGAGLGPNGTDEWLQAGISARAGAPPTLYVELVRPSGAPRYLPLRPRVAIGRGYDVAVLEEASRPGWWSVRLNGQRTSRPVYLPGSHGTWRPVATAESWSGAPGACNAFAFDFEQVRVAARPGGGWQPLRGAILRDPGLRLRLDGRAGFVVRGGPPLAAPVRYARRLPGRPERGSRGPEADPWLEPRLSTGNEQPLGMERAVSVRNHFRTTQKPS